MSVLPLFRSSFRVANPVAPRFLCSCTTSTRATSSRSATKGYRRSTTATLTVAHTTSMTCVLRSTVARLQLLFCLATLSHPSHFNGPQTTHRWLDMDESLSSCLGEPKVEVGWFSTDQLQDPPASTFFNLPTPHTHPISHAQEGQPTWCLEFRVKFYVDGSVTRPWSRRARYLLFLQLREDLALGRCAHTAVSRSPTKWGQQCYFSLMWPASFIFFSSIIFFSQLDCHS